MGKTHRHDNQCGGKSKKPYHNKMMLPKEGDDLKRGEFDTKEITTENKTFSKDCLI